MRPEQPLLRKVRRRRLHRASIRESRTACRRKAPRRTTRSHRGRRTSPHGSHARGGGGIGTPRATPNQHEHSGRSSTGLGKSHLASALANAACQKGHRVLFTTAVNIINQLQAAQADGTFMKRLRTYTAPDCLVIDDLGFLPIDRQSADLFFQVISGRYERGSVILTTNRLFKEWASVFNDATVAAAVIDRLAHRSEVILIEGRSYRLPAGEEPLAD